MQCFEMYHTWMLLGKSSYLLNLSLLVILKDSNFPYCSEQPNLENLVAWIYVRVGNMTILYGDTFQMMAHMHIWATLKNPKPFWHSIVLICS